MSTRRLGVAVAVLGGFLYAVGGSDGTSPLNTGEILSLMSMKSYTSDVQLRFCVQLCFPGSQWSDTTHKKTAGTPCLPWEPGGSTSAVRSTRTWFTPSEGETTPRSWAAPSVTTLGPISGLLSLPWRPGGAGWVCFSNMKACCGRRTCNWCLCVGGFGRGERPADGSRGLWWDDVFKNDRSLRPGRQHMEVMGTFSVAHVKKMFLNL